MNLRKLFELLFLIDYRDKENCDLKKMSRKRKMTNCELKQQKIILIV